MRRALALLALILAPTSAAVRGQTPVVPPAVAAFLQQFNSGAFTSGRFARWYSLYGPLQARYVGAGPGSAPVVWARGMETHAWLGIIPRATPDKFVVLTLGGAPPIPELRDTMARTPAQAALAIDAYLATQAAADRFSGVVLVANGDSILLRAAYGRAIRPDTRFSVASVGKMFTAVAVAQLRDQGALSFDDRVSRFLPAFRRGRTDPTIRQLLSHTSGVGLVPGWMRDRRDRSLVALATAIAAAPPAFAPGADVGYSNEGYILLGAIVEHVSRLPFATYLRRHVFAPAKMEATGFWSFAESAETATPMTLWRPDAAGDETYAGGRRIPATSFLRIRGTPAGGTISTADDLDRFLRALWSGTLVAPRTLAEMTTEQIAGRAPAPPGLPPRPGFGLGFELDGASGRVEKSGGALGVSAYVAVTPTRRVRVIVLSNYDSIAPLVGQAIEEVTCCLSALSNSPSR